MTKRIVRGTLLAVSIALAVSAVPAAGGVTDAKGGHNAILAIL